MAIYLLLLTVIFKLGSCATVFGIQHSWDRNYCMTNLIDSDRNFMEFSKEPSRSEFAIKGNLKALHCCVTNYRSVEWFKDGKPYPWHGTDSKFIVYPESFNQTIYAPVVSFDDAGNYTCLISNDTVLYAHTMILNVFERIPDDPLVTYVSENVQSSLGTTVRLFCEAFAGVYDLPDAFNEAMWYKDGKILNFNDDSRIQQKQVLREGGQTVGAYLVIKDLKIEDYGEYVCRINKPASSLDLHTQIQEPVVIIVRGTPNPVPYKKLLIAVGIGVLLFISAVILHIRYSLCLRVQLKDRFGRLPDNDGKNDILVLYSEKDSELSLGVLLSKLEAKYKYKCGSRVLPLNLNTWYKDLAEAFNKSHQIVAVISPSTIGDQWECSVLYQALKQLYELDSQFCCVTLKPFPRSGDQVKNSKGESFSSLVRSINVIHWERSKDEKFWLSLRLKLPPKRYSEIITTEIIQD